MRVLIIEDQLVDNRSHHFSYLSCIADAAKLKGISVDIAGRVDCTPIVLSSLPVFPSLYNFSNNRGNKALSVQNAPLRKVAIVKNIIRNAHIIREILLREPSYDLLLCLTASFPQLAMLAYMKSILRVQMPRIGALFVEYPKIHQKPTTRMRLTNLLVRILEPKISLFAETSYAQNEWSSFLLKQVDKLTHPVSLMRQTREPRSGCWEFGYNPLGSSGVNTPADNHGLLTLEPDTIFWKVRKSTNINITQAALSNRLPIQLTFGFYGFARHEQGVDTLMDALTILKNGGGINARFRIVWPAAFRLPDGSLCDSRNFAHLSPEVCFINHSLNPDEYVRALHSTDWVVLPYRRASYAGRISRICAECCILGIPVIYTKGTTTEEIISMCGSGIAIPDENPIALADAIRQAIAGNPVFQSRAESAVDSAKNFFSGDVFWNAVSKSTGFDRI